MSYVLVGTNAQSQVVVVGTKWGRPFQFEGPANAHLVDVRRDHPAYEWITVPLQRGPDGQHPGQGGSADPSVPLLAGSDR